MFKMVRYILLLLLTNVCVANTRVVVLDTGLSIQDPRFSNVLCKDVQSIDFTGEGIQDNFGHGTHIAGIIKQYAGNANYCITIIKYYSDSNTGQENLNNVIKALQWIHFIKPKFVNFSGGGPEWSDDEESYIKNTPGTTFIVSAGNDGLNLDKDCYYYPACYRLNNIIVVGSLKANGAKAEYSNFGNVINSFEIGERVKSTLPKGEGYMSGTSMATAVKTGKMIHDSK